MKEQVGKAILGLRMRTTNEIIAIYPEPLDSLNEENKKKVSDWYYKQSCGAEEILAHCFVDVIRENELH